MRVLLYSQDGMGLGHLRRACNIAREILARSPKSSILVVSDSPAVSLFPPLDGMDFLKLPTVVKTGDTTWQTGSFAEDIGSTIQLRSLLIRDSFLQFKPDIVLVDHMPVGALGELAPMLDCAANGSHPTRLFLGLRDVIDDPRVVCRVWQDLGAYDYLSHYEAVLIYGKEDMYDAATAYNITPHARKVVYCDYVTDADPHDDVDGDSRFVLLTGGGGADAYNLMQVFIDAFPRLARDTGLHAMVLPGPNMSPTNAKRLVDQVGSAPIEIVHGYRDATPLIRAAGAVVSMAGYNSVCEALKAGTKALIVPRKGPSAEQRMRTEIFADRRLIAALDPFELSVDTMAPALHKLLEEDVIPEAANIPSFDGAARTATYLLEGVGDERAPAFAGPIVA